jgi:hypothetical protein
VPEEDVEELDAIGQLSLLLQLDGDGDFQAFAREIFAAIKTGI